MRALRQMRASAAAPDPGPGPVAQALQGLVIGRLTWWMGWPLVLLGAAGPRGDLDELSTLIGFERLKAAATAEARARVSELYWEVVPAESLGPVIGH